jgi:hypothetical protein
MSKPITTKAKEILSRMIAVCIATSLGTIGAGSLLGVEVWKSAGLAALLGCAVVAESLARAYLADGELTATDINKAFSQINSDEDQSAQADDEEILCAPEAHADTHEGIK